MDLEASPATNTLPIKRAGKGRKTLDLTVAWLRFPSLKLMPLQQRYSRLGPGRYRYTSASGFVAELEVDGFGLVRQYGDYWISVDPRSS